MINEPLENAYFNWLCAKVARSQVTTPSLTYFNLLRELQTTEFGWIIPKDANRAEDGVELRYDFLRESFLAEDHDWMMLPCSVFEMMYALAKNAAFETTESAAWWFWTFIENLGLQDCNDASYFNPNQVGDVLHRLVWRQYNDTGQGGMFPIRDTLRDQREVEIWHQFCEYLADQE